MGVEERWDAIRELAGSDLAVMLNMDISTGYPKPKEGTTAYRFGNLRAGVAHTGPGSGYPDYTKKEQTK